MTYPVVTMEKAQELAGLLRAEIESDGDPLRVYLDEDQWCSSRTGDDYERQLIEGAAKVLKAQTIPKLKLGKPLPASEQYELEAAMAEEVHSFVSQLSMDMLEDEDFWRYLALFPFRWYLVARERELKPQDYGGFSETEDEDGTVKRQKKGLITQLLYRTFLWGKIAFDEFEKKKYRRVSSISKVGGPVIDIWHSHLIRTQLGQLGEMPHSFLDVVEGIKPVTAMKDKARNTEKRLARMKHNVLFDVYTKPESDVVVAEQLSKVN